MPAVTPYQPGGGFSIGRGGQSNMFGPISLFGGRVPGTGQSPPPVQQQTPSNRFGAMRPFGSGAGGSSGFGGGGAGISAGPLRYQGPGAPIPGQAGTPQYSPNTYNSRPMGQGDIYRQSLTQNAGRGQVAADPNQDFRQMQSFAGVDRYRQSMGLPALFDTSIQQYAPSQQRGPSAMDQYMQQWGPQTPSTPPAPVTPPVTPTTTPPVGGGGQQSFEPWLGGTGMAPKPGLGGGLQHIL